MKVKRINVKYRLKIFADFIKAFLKWAVIAAVTGAVTGLIGSFFNITVSRATAFRKGHDYIVFFLPLAGVAIVFLYHLCKVSVNTGTNLIISSVRSHEKIPLALVPLIFIGAALTHLFGGSAGREGAALQIGGSVGYKIGRLLRLSPRDMSVMVICGMSGLFSSLFGTPAAAAFFALEVISVGVIYYGALFASLVSALTAFGVTQLFRIAPERFDIGAIPAVSPVTLLKAAALAAGAAAVSILFCLAMEHTAKFFNSRFKNDYLRIIIGGGAVILLSLIFSSGDYNGAGMDVIKRALTEGETKQGAFLIKIIFTALTVGCGFKGGEIVPTLFIGATFGCFAGTVLGLPPSFAAALGLTAMFCGCVNCPAAAILLGLELFGAGGLVYFALVAAISFMLSGYYGLYSSQKIVYSKIRTEFININAK